MMGRWGVKNKDNMNIETKIGASRKRKIKQECETKKEEKQERRKKEGRKKGRKKGRKEGRKERSIYACCCLI